MGICKVRALVDEAALRLKQFLLVYLWFSVCMWRVVRQLPALQNYF